MMPMMNICSVVMRMLDFLMIMLVIMPSKIKSINRTVWMRMMVIIMSMPMRVSHVLMSMCVFMFFTIEHPERNDHERDCDPVQHSR